MFMKHSGFTLIEILVALVLLSIGLLGMAGLQILSLQSSSNALNRSQATILAADLVERMRSNQIGAMSNGYADITLVGAVQRSAPDSPDCIVTGCTPDQLAKQDVREWLENFSDVGDIGLDGDVWQPKLPEATAKLDVVSETDRQFQILISWTENNTGNKKQEVSSYTMDFAL